MGIRVRFINGVDEEDEILLSYKVCRPTINPES